MFTSLSDLAQQNAQNFEFESEGTQDPNWKSTIDKFSTPIRWDQSFPYQLIIVERNSDGGYIKSETYGAFTLPIPPQDISISMPFAITTSATLGGVVEEHNGAPFRMISFSGTTGVFLGRGSGDHIKDTSSFGAIAAGTLAAVNGVLDKVSALASSGPKNNSAHLASEFDNSIGLGGLTGYYQFRLLQRFLESYASLKKKSTGRTLRLAVAMHKDQAIYLCTPIQFDVRRSAGSPYEYTYQLSFKAWKRISLNKSPSAFERAGPSIRQPSMFSTLLNKLQEAREVIIAAQDVIAAIGGDINASLLEPMREVVYFAKDVIGISVSIADLPKSIIKDLKSVCTEASSLKGLDSKIKEYYQNTGKEIEEDLLDIQALGKDTSKDEVGPGDLSHTHKTLEGASPAAKIFEEPEKHHRFFASITPGDLNIPRSVQRNIDAETARIRALTRIDFEAMRDTVQTFTATFSEAVGAGSATYNDLFNLPASNVTRVPTTDEWDVIFALNQVILEMNRVAASGNVNHGTISTLDYVAGLAQASGIAFKVPTSKYAIPFPYGSTLEMIALTYLNDPQRWMEIAVLNGLQSPYVDEEGFDLYLTIGGSGNQVQVADASNLYSGQQVWLSSSNTTRTKRRIIKIEQITNNFTLTLDGDADLDRFSTMAGAVLRAYLPNTVNSMQQLYIPSDAPATDPDDKLKAIPGIDEFDPLIQVAGIDLLLTSNGDLAMTGDGDCQIAVGLNAIIQKVRIALGTPRGSMIHFPSYGLGIQLGMSVADLDIAEVRSSIQNLLTSDPTFEGIEGVKITLNGGTLKIDFGVIVTGVKQTIPVSFSVKR